MREQSQTIKYENFSSEYHSDDNYKKFTSAIKDAMEGGLLRYSRRVKLLNLADELGIERFEANLIIAQIQRRVMKDKPTFESINNSTEKSTDSKKSLREKLFTAAAIFLLAALTDLVLIRYLFGS